MNATSPVDVDVSFGGTTQTVRLGGYLRDAALAEAVAQVITDRSAQTLPPSVDLRSHCTRVEDQKHLASCTANASVGAIEYHRKKRNMDPIDLSALFVYYNTRRFRGDIETDTGAMIEECMASLIVHGAPRADLYPFNDPDCWKREPTAEAYQNAKLNEMVQYARVAPGAGILSTVAAGFPVVFGCFLPKIAYDFAGATGVMPELTEQQWASPSAGGHAMLIVGYDLIRELYVVRNSWGERWGDGGYAAIPFSVVKRAAPPESVWVVGGLEQDGGISIRPAQTQTKADAMRAEVRAGIGGDLAGLRAGLRDRLTRR